MSLTTYADLAKWKPVVGHVDTAIDIDSTPDPVPVHATMSEIVVTDAHELGQVEFTRNVPMWVMRGAPVSLRFPDETDALMDSGYSCWAIIAEPIRDEDTALVKDCTFVAASWPYSRGWLATSPFKRHWNESQETLRKKAHQKVQNFSQWREFIRELPENPFSTQKKLPKAVILDPNRIDEAIVPGTSFSLPRPCTSGKKDAKALLMPSTCYGLCRNFEDCQTALLVDPWISVLVEAATSGNLFRDFLKHHPILAPKSVSEEAEEVLDKVASRANDTVKHAIGVALAGPESFMNFRARNDAQGRARKLVSTLVGDIFMEMMWNFQRRKWAELKRMPTSTPISTPTGIRTTETPINLEQAIALEAQHLKTQTKSVLDSLIRRLLHDFDHPAEIRWFVADDMPMEDTAPNEANEVREKLVESCVLTAALFSIGVRDSRLSACIHELSHDSSPELRKIGQRFLGFIK